MKQKHYWLGLCLIVSLGIIYSACSPKDSYKELIVRMINARGGADILNIQKNYELFKMLANIAVNEKYPTLLKAEQDKKASLLVEKYLEKYVEKIQPYIEKNISSTELKAYVEAIENEDYSAIKDKLSQTTSRAFLNNVECSDSYKKTFKEYFEKSGISTTLNHFAGILERNNQRNSGAISIAINMLNGLGTEGIELLIRNYTVLCKITEEDMRKLIKIYEKPAYNGTMKATLEILEDPTIIDMASPDYFSKWVKEQEF